MVGNAGSVKQMDASTLKMLRSVASTRTYLPDEKVFIEGSPGNTMYVIIDGNVEISVAGKLIEIAGPGMIIGEMALIDSCNRSATVMAKDNCVLAQVNESEFLSLMEKTPHFGLSVMKILVTRLRNMDAMV